MNSNLGKSIAKNTAITSLGQIITITFLFINSILLANYLPPEELGTFFLIIAVWMFLQMIGNLGLDATLVKYIAAEKNRYKNEIFIKLLFLRILTLLTTAILFIIISKIFIIINDKVNEFSFLIILIFTLDSLRNFFNAELQGSKKFKDLIIVQIVLAVSKVSLYCILILINSLTINYLLYSEVLSIIISFIVQQSLTSMKIKTIYKIGLNELKDILKFSLPLYLNNLLGVFSNRINSIIIGSFLNIINVAYYEVGKKIPDGYSRLSNSITMVYYPYISELFAQNKIAQAKQLIEKYTNSISLIALPIILVSFVYNNEIVTLLFSTKYLKSAFAFSLFSVSFCFGLNSTLFGYTLVAANKPNLSFKVNLTKTIIALVLTLILTPNIGFMGAVYSILVASILGWLFNIYTLRYLNIKLSFIKLSYPFFVASPFILIDYYIKNLFGNNVYISFIIVLLFTIIEYFIFEDFKKIINHSKIYIILRFNKLFIKGKINEK